MVAVHITIKGRVQGVGYRASAERQAVQLGLNGWIRNRVDGTVEAVAQGPQDKVDAFVAWCRRGPPAARVEMVESTAVPEQPDLTDFDVRPRG